MTIPVDSVEIYGLSYQEPLKVISRAGALRTPAGWELTTADVPGPVELAPDAVGSWWQLDRAVEHGGYLYSGGVRRDGMVIAVQTNLTTKESVAHELIDFAPRDDHNNPGLLISDDLPPIVAVTQHNGTSRVWRGTVPGDLSTLAAPITLSWPEGPASYMQLRRVPGTNTIGLFTRSPAEKWYVRRSLDGGVTWQAAQLVVTFAVQGYIATVQHGSIVRCLAYEHPTISADHRIWRFDVDLVTGSIVDDTGAPIGSIGTGIAATAGTLVYDPADHPGVSYTRINDISTAADVEIGFTTYTSSNYARYYYARKSDGYAPKLMADAGSDIGFDTYMGGQAFINPTAGGTVYLARERGFWYVEKWVTTDGGNTWTVTPVSGPQRATQARPYPPINRTAGPAVTWYEITRYLTFTDFAGRSLAEYWP